MFPNPHGQNKQPDAHQRRLRNSSLFVLKVVKRSLGSYHHIFDAFHPHKNFDCITSVAGRWPLRVAAGCRPFRRPPAAGCKATTESKPKQIIAVMLRPSHQGIQGFVDGRGQD